MFNIYSPDEVLTNALYESQEGNAFHNDCGEAMALGPFLKTYNAISPTTTVANVVLDILGTGPDRGLYLDEITTYINAHGLVCSWQTITDLKILYDLLRQGKPLGLLILYKVLVDNYLTQFSNFTGQHYLALVGVNRTGFFAHDSYHTDSLGAYLFIPNQVLLDSMAQCSPSYRVLVPTREIYNIGYSPNTKNLYTVIAQYGANVRKLADQSSQLMGYLPYGSQVHVDILVPNGYSQIVAGQFKGYYIWTGYLTKA